MKNFKIKILIGFIAILFIIFLTNISNAADKTTYRIDNERRIISRIEPNYLLSSLKYDLGVKKIFKDENLTEEVEEYKSNPEDLELKANNISTGMCVVNRGVTYRLCVLGDFNGDSKATQIELSKTIKYMVGIRGTELSNLEYASADFNGDGLVDQRDITKFVNYLVYDKIDKTEPVSTDQWESEEIRVRELSKNINGWTNQNLIATAKAIDDKEGITSYKFCELSDFETTEWQNIETTKEEITRMYEINKKGIYGFYVQNDKEEIANSSIIINNIDKNKPTITNFQNSQVEIDRLSFNAHISDAESGISTYIVNYKKQGEAEYTQTIREDVPINDARAGLKENDIEFNIYDLEAGHYSVFLEVYDVAGNKEQTEEINIELKNNIAQIGNNKFLSLQSAIDSINNNTKTTINLLRNTEENISIPEGRRIILETSGYTISKDTENPVILVNQNSELVVNRGIIQNTGEGQAIKVLGNSKVSLSDAIVTSNSGTTIENNGQFSIIDGKAISLLGKVIENSGSLEIGLGLEVKNENENLVIENKQNAVLNISGSAVTSTIGNVIENNGTINMEEGLIEETGDGIVLYNKQIGSFTMTGGRISNTGNGTAVKNEGTFNLQGAIIENIGEGKAIENSEGAVFEISTDSGIFGETVGIERNEIISNPFKKIFSNLVNT